MNPGKKADNVFVTIQIFCITQFEYSMLFGEILNCCEINFHTTVRFFELKTINSYLYL